MAVKVQVNFLGFCPIASLPAWIWTAAGGKLTHRLVAPAVGDLLPCRFCKPCTAAVSKASCACKAQTAQVAGEDAVFSLHTRTVRVILSSVSGALQMAPMAMAAKPPSVHGAETLLRGV